jgi:hypothetical protein
LVHRFLEVCEVNVNLQVLQSRKLNVTLPQKNPTESAAITDPALRQQYADIERMLNMLAQ